MAHITKSKQHAYIKIKTLCGNTVTIIYASLKKVCGNATPGGITIRWSHKHFREGGVRMEHNPQFNHPSTAIDIT